MNETRSRFIEMVADGDVTIVELTRDGPRYEYTHKGLKKVCPYCRDRRMPRIVQAALAMVWGFVLVWVLASIAI
jgi:hypothetical protein